MREFYVKKPRIMSDPVRPQWHGKAFALLAGGMVIGASIVIAKTILVVARAVVR